MSAFVYAVHAIDTAAIVDLVYFRIDTGCFAITGTQAATIAFGRIDNRFENGKREINPKNVPTGQIVLQ